jgi:hypothetical protein
MAVADPGGARVAHSTQPSSRKATRRTATEYTNGFGIGDLLELAACADRPHDRLKERRQERYREGQSR